MFEKAHMNDKKTPHSPSLKLPKAILSSDRQQATGNRQQATGNRQQATGNYTHLLTNRVKTLKGLVLVRYSSQGLRPSRTINYPIVKYSPQNTTKERMAKPCVYKNQNKVLG
jgi:hypothetical protein